MVGVTGLEPATSRPPAVRATSCATPRRRSRHAGFRKRAIACLLQPQVVSSSQFCKVLQQCGTSQNW